MSLHRKPSRSVVNSLFVLTLFMLGYLGAIGFGTVWLRHRISVTANSNKVLEAQIIEAQRRVGEVVAEVATLQSPEQLLRQNTLLDLNLVRPREEQVVRVRDDVERRLTAKRYGQPVSMIASDRETRRPTRLPE
jgi:cell division protein FtsB